MHRWTGLLIVFLPATGMAGCNALVLPAADADVTALASKAVSVANEVGGATGFGGTSMAGYADHLPSQMGFVSRGDLASPGDGMTVHFRNESDQDATCHMSFVVSHMGLDEQMMDVEVPAGDESIVDLLCAEIVGRDERAGAFHCGGQFAWFSLIDNGECRHGTGLYGWRQTDETPGISLCL